MSKTNLWENELLLLYFNAIPIANLAANGSTPATTLTVALHTADPGEAGDQSTNEIAYTGYVRKAVARTSAGWTVTGNSVSPAAPIDFDIMTGGAGGVATHFSVGRGVSNKAEYVGAISPTINVGLGVVPRLTTATVIQED